MNLNTIYSGTLHLIYIYIYISINMEIHLKLTNLQSKFPLIAILKSYEIFKFFSKIENRVPLFNYKKLIIFYEIKKMQNTITQNNLEMKLKISL